MLPLSTSSLLPPPYSMRAKGSPGSLKPSPPTLPPSPSRRCNEGALSRLLLNVRLPNSPTVTPARRTKTAGWRPASGPTNGGRQALNGEENEAGRVKVEIYARKIQPLSAARRSQTGAVPAPGPGFSSIPSYLRPPEFQGGQPPPPPICRAFNPFLCAYCTTASF